MLISRKQIGRFRHQFLTPLGALAWLFFLRGKTKKGLPNIWTETENRGGPIREARKVYTAAGEEGGGREATCLHCLHAPQDVYTQSFFREKRAGETSHRFFKKRPLCPLAWFTHTHFTLRLLCPGEKRVRRVAESSSLVCVCVLCLSTTAHQATCGDGGGGGGFAARLRGGGKN